MGLVELMNLATAIAAAHTEITLLHAELKRLDAEMIPIQAVAHAAVVQRLVEAAVIVNEAIKAAAAGAKA